MPPTKELPEQQQSDPTAPVRPAHDEGVAGANGTHRGPLVAAILVLLIASTVVMVGFIWHRWNGVREPTTAVMLRGDETLDGAEITVSGERTVRATLNASNKYYVPILVDPGQYVVIVELRGTTLVRTTVEVKRFLGVEFNLSAIAKEAIARGTLTLHSLPPPPTTPASQPAN
jgi:hypothetical protein